MPLAEMGAGEVFGEMSLLTGRARSASVTARSEVNLWSLSEADFNDLATAYPNLALALSRLLSERLRDTDERFLSQPSATAAAPLAAPPAAKPAPKPAPKPQPAIKPSAKAQPAAVVPKRRRRLATEVSDTFDGAVTWFGSLSRGAKVRLVLFTLLIAWLVCIAAPALVISTLAADDVTNLEGAIAFVQTATPVPSDTPLPTDTPVPPEPVLSIASEPTVEAGVEPVAQVAPEATVGDPALPPLEAAAEAPAEVAPAPSEVPTSEQPPVEQVTATPWIIVITNTPAPPTDTPIPTDTPVPPTATPQPVRVSSAAEPVPPTATPAGKPQLPRDLDDRLASLNVTIQPAGVRPGQSYYRLIAARWEDEIQAGGGHSIFIDVLDQGGAKIMGQPIEIRWMGGGLTVFTEEKPPNEPSANFPMYNTLGSYAVSVAGLPSDVVVGLGLGRAEQPHVKFHTNFFLTFQRTTR